MRRPWANASSPRPSRIGHGRRRTFCSGRNASTGSSSSMRLPARSATTRRTWSGASRPEIRANSATSRASVRVPSISWASCDLLGREPQVAGPPRRRASAASCTATPRALTSSTCSMPARSVGRALAGLTRSATAAQSPGSAGPNGWPGARPASASHRLIRVSTTATPVTPHTHTPACSVGARRHPARPSVG